MLSNEHILNLKQKRIRTRVCFDHLNLPSQAQHSNSYKIGYHFWILNFIQI
jgi:hypothetical protein